MKFRMFTDAMSGNKVALNVDQVAVVYEYAELPREQRGVKLARSQVIMSGSRRECIYLAEDYDTVLARLNTIAD